MNREIAELREVIQKLVPLLAGKGLVVTQRGSQAYVKTNPATRQPESVNIPNITENATPEFIEAIQGFIDHEVGHVLHTDFLVYGQPSAKIPKSQRQQFSNTHNIVEDTMIEREMAKTFPGSKRNISRTRIYFLDKITAKALASAKDDKEAFIYLLVPTMRALAGHEEMQEFMDKNGYWSNPFVDAVVKGLTPATLSLLKTATNTKQTLEIAEELHLLLYPPAPATPPAPPVAPPSPTPPEPPKPEEKDEDEDLKDAGAGDGKEERKHEETGEDGEGDAEKKDKSDEAEKGEGEAEPDAEGEEGEPEDDDGAAESGAPDDEDGAEPEESDASADGDAADEGDAGEDDGDADGSSDAGEDADDGGAPGAGSSNDSDDGDDAKDDDGGSVGAKIVTDGAEGEGASSINDEERESDGGGGGVGNEQTKSIFEFDEDAFESADMSSQIAILISTDAVAAMDPKQYKVFTREADEIKPVEPPENINGKWIPDMEDETRTMTARMRKDIERIMASQSHVIRTPGHRRGRLHSPSLYRVTLGDPRAFSQKEEHVSKDTAVTLMIDNSGSMHGPKMKLAMISGYALSSTLDAVKIANEVIGFTTGNYWSMPESLREAMEIDIAKSGVRYDRIEPLIMPIYKDFRDRIDSVVKKRFAYMMNAQDGLNGNIDGESLLYGAERLLKRPEKRKVMMVLSDGQPVGTNAGPHLSAVVKDLEKSGIETIGIGIMSEAVKKFYPKSVVIQSAAELPNEVMTEIKRILA